jgi:NADH dehydrogenase FAD-containing subunit
MIANTPRKHLVLLGAGRAHLQVLKGLARQPGSDISATLVAPTPYYVEAAMLPGHVAGHYELDDIRIPLDALVEASGVAFVPAHVLALDPSGRRVQLSSGDALPYDVLSVDVEPVVERDRIEAVVPGSRRNALFTRPLENFVQLWPQLLELARTRPLQVAVLAAELPDIELAMAMATALAAPHGSRVTLVAGEAPLLADQPPALQRRLQTRLQALGITVLHDQCVGIDAQYLELASGARLQCDAPVFASGTGTPAWLLESGLQLTDTGALQLNERMQSDSHRQVFVAPPDASAETGPVLEANLRTALGGGSFRKASLATPRLHVLGCGHGHAVAAWGPLSLEGREVWNWKDRRDRRQLAALFTL